MPNKISDQSGILWIMYDLVADFRNGDASCLPQIKALWKNRHTVKLDNYGWPILPEFAPPVVGAVANLKNLQELCKVAT